MIYNQLIFPTLGIFLLLYVVGQRISLQKLPIWKRLVILDISLLPALPAVLFAAYYLHWFDNTVWFYQLRAINYIELPAGGIGFTTGIYSRVVRDFASRKLLAALEVFVPGVMTLAALVVLVVPYIKPVIMPLSIYDAMKDTWKDEVCIQSTPSSYGLASAATILAKYGHKTSETELARECYTSGTGTENWYIARALRKRGLKVTYIIQSPDTLAGEADVPYPSIAGTGINNMGHFITVLDKTGDIYVIGDPLTGRQILREEDLHKEHQFTGFFMLVEAN